MTSPFAPVLSLEDLNQVVFGEWTGTGSEKGVSFGLKATIKSKTPLTKSPSQPPDGYFCIPIEIHFERLDSTGKVTEHFDFKKVLISHSGGLHLFAPEDEEALKAIPIEVFKANIQTRPNPQLESLMMGSFAVGLREFHLNLEKKAIKHE